MKIGLGTDHAGYHLKEDIKKWLQQQGHEVIDYGTYSEESVNYIDYVYKACKSVTDQETDRAIVFCGTGLGASYVANKVHGIRAALCEQEFSTRMSRLHNDSNVLVLGGRIITSLRAQELVSIWLETEFEGGRHSERVQQIHEIELKECQSKNN